MSKKQGNGDQFDRFSTFFIDLSRDSTNRTSKIGNKKVIKMFGSSNNGVNLPNK